MSTPVDIYVKSASGRIIKIFAGLAQRAAQDFAKKYTKEFGIQTILWASYEDGTYRKMEG